MTLPLDDLDDRILAHFAARFPRPARIDFCAYDVDEAQMLALCAGPPPLDLSLIGNFVANGRHGMFGDWRDFPPFVGDVAVHARRASLMLEHDLAFFHLHVGPDGAFDDGDRAVLATWAEDILAPWQIQIERAGRSEPGELLELLILLARCGGDPERVIVRSLNRARRINGPTLLMAALAMFLGPDGAVDAARIRDHFRGFDRCTSNQTLPPGPLVPAPFIDALIETVGRHANAVAARIPADCASMVWLSNGNLVDSL